MKTFKQFAEKLEHIGVPLKKIDTDLKNRKRVKDFQDKYRSPDKKGTDY